MRDDTRRETRLERLDRNWTDLLQELRVLLTGVQLLSGFLLILPFQQRFAELNATQRGLYLTATSTAVLAVALLQTPVSVHRVLFRRHRRATAVRLAHRFTVLGIVLLAMAMVAVVSLIFDVLLGSAGAIAAGTSTAGVLVALWLVVPWLSRTHLD